MGNGFGTGPTTSNVSGKKCGEAQTTSHAGFGINVFMLLDWWIGCGDTTIRTATKQFSWGIFNKGVRHGHMEITRNSSLGNYCARGVGVYLPKRLRLRDVR